MNTAILWLTNMSKNICSWLTGDELAMSLFEHWVKSAVWFCHTKTGWVVSSSLPSKTKLHNKENMFFFFPFCHFLFVLPMTFLLVCCSVTPCLNPPPHPTPPTLSLPVWFHAAKKGADSRRVSPSGYWPSHMTEQMLSSNRGPRQQLGFVMRRREGGSFVQPSEWAASVTNHFSTHKSTRSISLRVADCKSGKVSPMVLASRVPNWFSHAPEKGFKSDATPAKKD